MPWGYAAAAAIGGGLASDASKSAANTQANSARQASEAQQAQFNQTQTNLQPWMQGGNVALSELMTRLGVGTAPGSVGANVAGQSEDQIRQSLIDDWKRQGGPVDENGNPIDPYNGIGKALAQNLQNQSKYNQNVQAEQQAKQSGTFGSLLKPFSMSDFQASPAYQFNLEQGQKAIDKAAAKRGNFYAPATLQDVSKFSQGLASNEFQNAYSNYNTNLNNVWSRLYGLSGSGQNAAANVGGFGAGAATQIGNNLIGAGNAQAAGTVGSANAYTGAANNAYNQYVMQQILANNQQSSVPSNSQANQIP